MIKIINRIVPTSILAVLFFFIYRYFDFIRYGGLDVVQLKFFPAVSVSLLIICIMNFFILKTGNYGTWITIVFIDTLICLFARNIMPNLTGREHLTTLQRFFSCHTAVCMLFLAFTSRNKSFSYLKYKEFEYIASLAAVIPLIYAFSFGKYSDILFGIIIFLLNLLVCIISIINIAENSFEKNNIIKQTGFMIFSASAAVFCNPLTKFAYIAGFAMMVAAHSAIIYGNEKALT